MKIIYQNDEGGVSVITPVINDEIGLTIGEIATKDVPSGKAFQIVDDNEIPKDRIFRNAWKKGNGKVEVDMPKARIIHMDRIRKVRDTELEKSDKEVVRVLEDGGNLTALKAKRKKLRDIPKDFDLESVNTSDGLKNKWPVELPRNAS